MEVNMHKHKHCHCNHDLKYCSCCDVVYCVKCGREWGSFAYRGITWYPWTYTSTGGTQITYSDTTTLCTNNHANCGG